jgi:hypothetical protein
MRRRLDALRELPSAALDTTEKNGSYQRRLRKVNGPVLRDSSPRVLSAESWMDADQRALLKPRVLGWAAGEDGD